MPDQAMTVDTNESIYQTGEYAEKNPTYHVEDSAWKAGQVLKMIEKHHLRPGSVCEVGCGAGEILKELQTHLPAHTQFFGYEISPQAFALCQNRANDRLQFFCEDFLATEPKAFDLLLCLDVLEHVEDYFGFLRRLRERGDYKVFHIPLDMSVQGVWRRQPILRVREQAGHLHYFMKETALATLYEAGYEVIDCFYTGGAIANPQSVKAKLARWPRKLLSAVNPDLVVRMLGGYSLLVLAK